MTMFVSHHVVLEDGAN